MGCLLWRVGCYRLSNDSTSWSASLPSHSRAPIARPTIVPWRSTITVTGIQRMPYSCATAMRGSSSVATRKPCLSMYGFTSFSPRPSRATKYTARSLGKRAWRFSRLLSSDVQVVHQVAPKLRMASFPSSADEATVWPAKSGSLKAGAALGLGSRMKKTDESWAALKLAVRASRAAAATAMYLIVDDRILRPGPRLVKLAPPGDNPRHGKKGPLHRCGSHRQLPGRIPVPGGPRRHARRSLGRASRDHPPARNLGHGPA